MNKRPFFAAMLLGGLSLAGILAMFSQTEPVPGTVNAIHAMGPRRVSLNPSGSSTDSEEPHFGDVLPGVVEEGIEHQLEKMSSDEEKNATAKPRRNILRLR